MVFSSTLFIFIFLPVSLLGYYLIKEKFCNYWLLFVSLMFFAWSQPQYLWIICFNIVVNYCCARLIDDLVKLRKSVLIAAILVNLGILYYYKYFDFMIDSFNNITGLSFDLKGIVLPIGISFFTFQGMSYVIDVYRKEVPAQKNPFKVALYITLFPQLIAGPIVRYTDIANEIDRRKTTIEDFSDGIQQFIIGLSKKTIIANTMAVLVDNVWNNGAANNSGTIAWIASIAYTLQIYFDFSGYSDMAIGLGKLYGFHFNMNFDLPYTSKSISEFWRRWHISLSSWFRDYVYIPLGGNRKRVYLNLAIVFILTGIWHGASWHFLIWGVINGLFILLERYLKGKLKITINGRIKIILSKIYTLFVVNLGWILFRAPTTKEALQFILSIFGVSDASYARFKLAWYMDGWTATIFIIGIFFASSIPTKIGNVLCTKLNGNVYSIIKYTALAALFYMSLLRIVSGTYNPFIYFQF